MLITAATFFSADVQAQFNATVIKYDTSNRAAGSASKIVINKLDSELVYWDKYSYKKIALALADTAAFDFASSGATTVSDLTKTIAGARVGDEVVLGIPNGSVTATASFTAWVSAANTVTVRFSPKATENPASGVFHITVLKYHKWH